MNIHAVWTVGLEGMGSGEEDMADPEDLDEFESLVVTTCL